MRFLRLTTFVLYMLAAVPAWASFADDLASCGPTSNYLDPQLDFCADWNPEFPWNGYQCCRKGKPVSRRGSRRGRGARCYAQRAKPSYCDEMTPEQAQYAQDVAEGKIQDVLAFLREDSTKRVQSYCSVNNGFLAWGRPIVPTPENRLMLRTPHRCTYFGTDGMAGMLEWVGHQIKGHYSDPQFTAVKLVVGDISAPRGGCLAGRSGRVGHASHTSGVDADIGFLVGQSRAPASTQFSTKFDPKTNWWLIKQIFNNPFACVKVVFLDKRHIRKLSREVAKDPGEEAEWRRISKFIHHIPGHRNHLHIRVGDAAGAPGCGRGPEASDTQESLEQEEDIEGQDWPA